MSVLNSTMVSAVAVPSRYKRSGRRHYFKHPCREFKAMPESATASLAFAKAPFAAVQYPHAPR